MFALLKPTFSLPLRPHYLTAMLHPRAERSPTAILRLKIFTFALVLPVGQTGNDEIKALCNTLCVSIKLRFFLTKDYPQLRQAA
jgi:hypothetical protein